MAALDRTLGNAMTRKVSDTALDVILSYPINENEFLQWRDAQEVEQAVVHSAAKGHGPCTCGVRLNQWCGQRQSDSGLLTDIFKAYYQARSYSEN